MSGVADLLMALMSGPPGVLSNISYGANDAQLAPAGAFAGVTFESDGDVIETTSGGATDAADWITPKAIAPNLYEIRFHQNSGATLDGGSATLDTWLALTADRGVALTQSGAGSKSANLTVSIRYNGGPTLKSGTVSLDVTVA